MKTSIKASIKHGMVEWSWGNWLNSKGVKLGVVAIFGFETSRLLYDTVRYNYRHRTNLRYLQGKKRTDLHFGCYWMILE